VTPAKQITCIATGAALLIAALWASRREFYTYQDSFRSITLENDMLLDASLITALALILIGVIPWHKFSRQKN